MESFKPPVPIEWAAQRVLTTAQLAEYYGCDVHNIKKNFNSNKSRFVEGTHYFKLTGKDLEDLRVTFGDPQNLQVTFGDPQISPKTRMLYLWTARGAARHAKMLSTDKAWDVYEKLEDFYFRFHQGETAPVPALTPNARSEAQKRPARVYAAEMSNGLVKIGNSSIVRPRVAKIKRETKSKVVDIYISPLMPREKARLIEWACQEKFSSRRVEGEFFSVPFEEVCAEINCMVNIIRADIVVDKKIN